MFGIPAHFGEIMSKSVQFHRLLHDVFSGRKLLPLQEEDLIKLAQYFLAIANNLHESVPAVEGRERTGLGKRTIAALSAVTGCRIVHDGPDRKRYIDVGNLRRALRSVTGLLAEMPLGKLEENGGVSSALTDSLQQLIELRTFMDEAINHIRNALGQVALTDATIAIQKGMEEVAPIVNDIEQRSALAAMTTQVKAVIANPATAFNHLDSSAAHNIALIDTVRHSYGRGEPLGRTAVDYLISISYTFERLRQTNRHIYGVMTVHGQFHGLYADAVKAAKEESIETYINSRWEPVTVRKFWADVEKYTKILPDAKAEDVLEAVFDDYRTKDQTLDLGAIEKVLADVELKVQQHVNKLAELTTKDGQFSGEKLAEGNHDQAEH